MCSTCLIFYRSTLVAQGPIHGSAIIGLLHGEMNGLPELADALGCTTLSLEAVTTLVIADAADVIKSPAVISLMQSLDLH